MINFNADKARFLSLNTTIIGFDYWDIVFEKMTEWRTPIEILFEIRTSELIAGKPYFLLENPSF